MDKPANKSLVDVLEDESCSAYAEAAASPSGADSINWQAIGGAYEKSRELAKPYEAQRIALEKVAVIARRLSAANPSFDILAGLHEALAAVPPLPEVQDGS